MQQKKAITRPPIKLREFNEPIQLNYKREPFELNGNSKLLSVYQPKNALPKIEEKQMKY